VKKSKELKTSLEPDNRQVVEDDKNKNTQYQHQVNEVQLALKKPPTKKVKLQLSSRHQQL
jgi:hypothetical protein